MNEILKEIHERMEKVYEEGKNLSSAERIKKIRKEAESLIEEKNEIKKGISLCKNSGFIKKQENFMRNWTKIN